MTGAIKAYPYQQNEEQAIAGLDAATHKSVPDLDLNLGEISLVYEEGGKVLGRIVGSIFCDILDIHFFIVEEAMRGKGIGGKLIVAAEAEAMKRGCRHVKLESMSWNTWQFYPAHGYEVLAKIEDSPYPGAVHYLFHKKL